MRLSECVRFLFTSCEESQTNEWAQWTSEFAIKNWILWIRITIVHRSNVSVKSKLQHAPPRATTRAFDLFENYCSNTPLPGPKCRSNVPHWGPFRWSNAPTLGTFHRHKNDGRTAETPSVVEQNLYKYNKNWETLLAYLLRTKVSCKAAEIAATRSLNAQLFFVMQHTKRSIKKDSTYWDYYIMTISLTGIIAHLIS